jgi:(2Fe-2S) ferredoxin
LKKQTKKLAKTLKTHRKRLESMLASAVTSPQDTSQLQMQAVLAEMVHLQDALQSIRALQEQQERHNDSSDSDSDSECEHEHRGRSRLAPISRPSMVVAAAAVAVSSKVLEPPPVDQEMPEITQQLPPPQMYSGTGRILVCQGKACTAKGGLQVIQAASHAAAASPSIEVIPCKCLGKCKQGPAMRLRSEQPGCILLTQVSPLEVPEALEQAYGNSSSLN